MMVNKGRWQIESCQWRGRGGHGREAGEVREKRKQKKGGEREINIESDHEEEDTHTPGPSLQLGLTASH